MSTEAKVVITGRNDLAYAVKSAEGQLRGLLKTGELVGKFFRGGAIVAAALAFERLAENAQRAAEEIGDKGTASALRQLNTEIDRLKSKGTNLIGKVLGNVYTAFRGDELAKVREQIDFLQRMQGRSFLAAGYGKIGTGFFTAAEGAAKLRELQALERQIDPTVAPLGSFARTRAMSRGGGSEQLVRSLPPATPKAAGGGAAETPQPFTDAEWAAYERNIIRPIQAWNELGEASAAAMDDITESVAKWAEDGLEQLAGPVQQAAEKWSVFADQAARDMQTSFAQYLFDPFKEGLDGMLQGFVDIVRQMIAQWLAFQAFQAAGAALSTSSNSFVASIGGFLQGRAGGGPVSRGTPYMVGERGPEVFVPNTSGRIIPNSGGSAMNLTYHIDARGADAERIMAVLPAMLQRTKQETVAAVLDLQRRGRLA